MSTNSTDGYENSLFSIDEKFSPKVNGLFGIAKSIGIIQFIEDDRLAYLLDK